MSGALFLKLFPNTRKKLILFKATKKSQVSGHINFKHTLFFPGYFNLSYFKVVSRTDSKLWTESCQNTI